jgi:hypothetical protein
MTARREYIFAVTCMNDFDCSFIEWKSRLPANSNLYSIAEGTIVARLSLNVWERIMQKNPCVKSRFNDFLLAKHQNIEARLIANLFEVKGAERLKRALLEIPALDLLLNK